MKRWVGCIDGSGRGTVLEADLPPLRPGQVQVAVAASLISPGTELAGLRQRRQQPSADRAPRPFGYAAAGAVEWVGDGVTQFRVGERVACMGAGYALHADRVCVPQNLCARLPDGLDPVEGAFAHLAATGLHAIRRTEPRFGENGMVVGLGLVGQLCAQVAQLSGCHVLGVDRFRLRLEAAGRAGVEATVDPVAEDVVARAADFTGGYGMDFGIIAFGGDATSAFEQIVTCLKTAPDTHRMGRVVIVGGAQVAHGFAAALGNVDLRSAARTGPGYHDEAYEHGHGYPPVFVEWTTQRNLAECLRAMAAGRLRVRPLITHELPLARIGEAVDVLVETPERALGVVLRP